MNNYVCYNYAGFHGKTNKKKHNGSLYRLLVSIALALSSSQFSVVISQNADLNNEIVVQFGDIDLNAMLQ